MSDTALSYHEPGIILILAQSSFLILLNVVGSTIDHYLYCGLVAQVLLGMAWGKPGANILSDDFQQVVTQLGYLGLIAIIFEGGLSTSARTIQQNLQLSICVALTGILLPLGLSYSLLSLASATKLQAFAAGAALCSTSLGTTFNLLKTTDLTSTRLGVVLTSAAMLDDVIGLIMIQILSNLGSNTGSLKAATVVRPVFVSIGFATVLVLVCAYICKPIMRFPPVQTLVNSLLVNSLVYFLVCTIFLLALITSASYAGTSILFATYLAGACLSWLATDPGRPEKPSAEVISIALTPAENCSTAHTPSSCVSGLTGQGLPERQQDTSPEISLEPSIKPDGSAQQPTPPPEDGKPWTAGSPVASSTISRGGSLEQTGRSMRMYHAYYAPSVDHILKPFFFVCIRWRRPQSVNNHADKLLGIYRLFNTYCKDVPSPSTLAWYYLCHTYVIW